MRIVYVLTTLAVGGTERQVLFIAGRMAARGNWRVMRECSSLRKTRMRWPALCVT